MTRGRKPTGKTRTGKSISFPTDFLENLMWLAMLNRRTLSNLVVYLVEVGLEHADLRREVTK